MRTKVLLKHFFKISKLAIILFAAIFFSATLGVAVIMLAMFKSENIDTQISTQTTIVSYAIFMFISSLIISQKETKFLITRSVSRVEIFTAYSVFLLPFAALMSGIQILTVYLLDLSYALFGAELRGLEIDTQSLLSPDMKNVFIFFAVSFSLMLCASAIGYLLGVLAGRFKFQTVVVLGISAFALFAYITAPNGISNIFKILKFMFSDDKYGLIIALKQITTAIVLMAISFPVMRKLTAEKGATQ